MPEPIFAARRISKCFGPVKALDEVDLALEGAEVHALMGENGAGKSTLIQCLTGVHAPDAGAFFLCGELLRIQSPREAERKGISTVFQEVNLLPHLSIAENMCIGREPVWSRWFRKIRWSRVRAKARAAVGRLGLRLDVNKELGQCSIAVQQLVAIARAMDVQARVLILDEPTSSLDRGETERLFALLRQLRQAGLAILLVTHFLDQVYALADRVTVLRDGRRVGEHRMADLPREKLVRLMVGRELSQTVSSDHQGAPSAMVGKALLEAKDLYRRNAVHGVSLDLRAGDCLGLCGLLGSGRTETARLLFGADHPTGGELLVDGEAARLRTPRDAVRCGIAMTPEDRKAEGIFPHLSVADNIVLALESNAVGKRLSARERHDLVARFIRMLGIKTPGPHTPVASLSGGNQQKVILARWLALSPRILILDEPTRGIDIGAKAEITTAIQTLRADGTAIVFISSEIEETPRVCNRALVLRDRRAVGELRGPQVNEDAILAAIAADA